MSHFRRDRRRRRIDRLWRDILAVPQAENHRVLARDATMADAHSQERPAQTGPDVLWPAPCERQAVAVAQPTRQSVRAFLQSRRWLGFAITHGVVRPDGQPVAPANFQEWARRRFPNSAAPEAAQTATTVAARAVALRRVISRVVRRLDQMASVAWPMLPASEAAAARSLAMHVTLSGWDDTPCRRRY